MVGVAVRRLLLLLLLLDAAPASAKRRKGAQAQGANKKRACEKVECADVHEDDRPNCVLKCQSEACYAEVYSEELEPGEIDLVRQRAFNSCLSAEARRRLSSPKRVPPGNEEADGGGGGDGGGGDGGEL